MKSFRHCKRCKLIREIEDGLHCDDCEKKLKIAGNIEATLNVFAREVSDPVVKAQVAVSAKLAAMGSQKGSS